MNIGNKNSTQTSSSGKIKLRTEKLQILKEKKEEPNMKLEIKSAKDNNR